MSMDNNDFVNISMEDSQQFNERIRDLEERMSVLGVGDLNGSSANTVADNENQFENKMMRLIGRLEGKFEIQSNEIQELKRKLSEDSKTHAFKIQELERKNLELESKIANLIVSNESRAVENEELRDKNTELEEKLTDLTSKVNQDLSQIEDKVPSIESVIDFFKKEKSDLAKDTFDKAKCHQSNKQYEQALRLYENALQYERIGFNDTESIIQTLEGMSRCFWDLNDSDKQIAILSQIIELDRCCVKRYFDRGEVYMRLKNHKLALKDFNKMLQLEESAYCYFIRAHFYSQMGKFELALADNNETVELEPTGLHYHRRGCTHFQMGNFQEALNDFDEALKLTPSFPFIRKWRNRCLRAMGRI